MSADRQRLKSAIQRIAKEDPQIRNLLGEGQNKGGKASSAGVGTSEAEGSRLCCDGSTSGSANPGTGERDPDASNQDGLNSDDPASLESGDGTLSGVTDCATGEPICFDGAGFIPPDGWESPTEPPVADDYQDGFYWSDANNNEYSRSADPFQSATNILSVFNEQQNTNYVIYEKEVLSESRIKYLVKEDGSPVIREVVVDRRECSAGTTEDYCTQTPYADTWPSDGCANLAIIGGKIVGSKYDPENDGSYSAPRDSIDLCSGTEQISLAPAANGGWKTINSTTDNGYLYDSSGQQIAHIDGNEYSDPSV